LWNQWSALSAPAGPLAVPMVLASLPNHVRQGAQQDEEEHGEHNIRSAEPTKNCHSQTPDDENEKRVEYEAHKGLGTRMGIKEITESHRNLHEHQ
jgi:hypothetical protein